MALNKAGLQTTLEGIFGDVSENKTAASAAEAMANAIEAYVKTAIATVVIPPGSVVVGAAPIAAPVLNVAPISLTGDPDAVGPLKGGLT